MKKLHKIGLAMFTVFMLSLCAVSAQSKKLTFETADLDDNKVTSDIFSKADITVINIWATWCPPCRGELPELGKWAASMPKNVQLIGMLTDSTDRYGKKDAKAIARAKEILKKAGADFVNLQCGYDLYEKLNEIAPSDGIPTTLFVDKNGNKIGEHVIGANVPKYKKIVEDYLKNK